MADNLHLPIKTTKKCTSSTHLRAFFISYHQVSFCCISKVIIVPLLTWPVWTAHVQMHDAGLRLLSSGSRTVHQDTFWQSGSAFLSTQVSVELTDTKQVEAKDAGRPTMGREVQHNHLVLIPAYLFKCPEGGKKKHVYHHLLTSQIAICGCLTQQYTWICLQRQLPCSKWFLTDLSHIFSVVMPKQLLILLIPYTTVKSLY